MELVRYLSRHGAGRIARIAMVAPNTPLIVKTADNPDGVDRRVLEGALARLSPSSRIRVRKPGFLIFFELSR
jgi:non-heme chloroperoxidase